MAEDITVLLEGRITAFSAAPIWQTALESLERYPDRQVIVDAARLEHVDNVGLALLFDLSRRGAEIRALAPRFDAMVRRYDPHAFALPVIGTRSQGAFEQVGRSVARQAAYLRELVGFLGECVHALFHARSRRLLKWGDLLDVATETGANAVPIVLLVGFLMGVIIAFELGLVARQFGAVIFVVNGGAVAVLRELSPLMTAIVFAGRTGAAFAAQLGAQKVNEELDALSTFGLHPIGFLVLPRIVTSILIVPMLTVLADVVGLLGGALVMTSFGVSFLQSYTQLLGAVTSWDLLLGLIKAAFFGLTIAAVGCHQGLSTGAGASAVGHSATRAVVASIVLIIVIDGVFALLTS